MGKRTLVRSRLNAKSVANTLLGQQLFSNISNYILERNLINAVIVDGVLEPHILLRYIKDSTQARGPVNARSVASVLQR